MIYKFTYNWEYSKESIVLKIYKNKSIKKEFNGNTSPNTDEIVFKCDEFKHIENYVVNLYGQIKNETIKDYAFNMWTYIQNNETDKESFHKHLNLDGGKTELKTDYTFVFYVQIPKNITENEGDIVFIEDNGDKNMTFVRPQEGEILFFPGELSHCPKLTPKAEIDRIVIAGNITNNFSPLKNLL